jgi:hypothetical protein
MISFPLLLIPLAIYNIIVLLMPGVSFADPLFRLTLVSGTEWSVTLSDLLLAIGILMLLLEVLKGARPGAKYLTDHLLSLILFGAAAAEFVLWPKFGTSTYFLLGLLALTDFLSGIALRARRSVRVTPAADAPLRQRAPSKADAPAAEPQLDPGPGPGPGPSPGPAPGPSPAPAPAPPAPSVAESVRLDHPEPNPAQPAAASSASSPEVASPGLQPGNGPHASPETPSH